MGATGFRRRHRANGVIEEQTIERPAKGAKVAEWRDYAIANGFDAELVGSLKRAEIIELVDTKRDEVEPAQVTADSDSAADPNREPVEGEPGSESDEDESGESADESAE